MNNKKRFILGVISTLLFTVGLTRAADQLDPTRAPKQARPVALSPGGDCLVEPCILQPCRML